MPKVDEPENRDSKVWDQIEEILDKDNRGSQREPIRIARSVAPRKVRARTPIWHPTPEKLIAVGVLLMLAAAISRQFVLPLTLGGFLLAGAGYYQIVTRKRGKKFGSGSGADSVKYWRGKPVTPPDRPTKRNGNIIDFPGTSDSKPKRRFGRKQ